MNVSPVSHCEIKSCTNKVFGRFNRIGEFLCSRHYYQIRRHGKILSRTQRDKAEFFYCGDYYEVAIYNKKQIEVARTKIDKSDFDFVMQHRWNLDGNGYVCSKIPERRLHRALAKTPKGMDTDHINRDKLDNRKANLRIVTHWENTLNRKQTGDGVSLRKDRKKWRARIKTKGKEKFLGYFDTEQEAIDFRKQYLSNLLPVN